MALHTLLFLGLRQIGKRLASTSVRQKRLNGSEKEAVSELNNGVTHLAGSHHIGHAINAAKNVDAPAPFPILDPQLGVQLTFGDAEIWNTVLGMLFDSLPDYSAKLTAARHNMEDLRQTAHKLVSASCYTGTPAMKHAAQQVERFAKAGKTDAATEALDTLLQQIERLLALRDNGELHTKKELVY